MLSCDHCNYQIAYSKIMDIHNHTYHGKEEKYNCDSCDNKISKKKSKARHKKIVHEGVKYHCRQWDYQVSLKGNLA